MIKYIIHMVVKDCSKTAQEAFNEVKEGKAVNGIPSGAKEASIVEVGIGYWEDYDLPYLQPVYVFSGETFKNILFGIPVKGLCGCSIEHQVGVLPGSKDGLSKLVKGPRLNFSLTSIVVARR
ncbi:MAG: hypothetical protein IBX64_13100 [Actinobacteria bacterium]|nr:hypothetical protein [Actinomycetota bacterium]